MKILLLGEYSNVHWTLAKGLRRLGHQVTVISDGDGWKNYPCDISLRRTSTGWKGTLSYLARLLKNLPAMKGYDVVQLINPIFLELKAERMYFFYDYLRKYNRSVFMGAFGMDYYWVKTALDARTFRYSDFNIGAQIRKNADNTAFIAEWLEGPKGKLNRYIAEDCDGIVTGLYEYDVCYQSAFPDKTRYIPFPIDCESPGSFTRNPQGRKIRFFIGIQRTRDAYKGTDIMYKALLRAGRQYASKLEIMKAESIPFNEYQHMMDQSDILLDQLYSYTPAMNALQAMAKGMVVVGGGEEENYLILDEKELRPIINVVPDEEDVYRKLEQLVLHPEQIPVLSEQSRKYIARHHDHLKVAEKYIEFWSGRLQTHTES